MNEGMGFQPAYQSLLKRGELARRVADLDQRLAPCRVCPWKCGVDRRAGETGVCGSEYLPLIASYAPHFGEEPVLSGTHLPRGAARGSGNIFLGHCNLRCVFCQNAQISQDFRRSAPFNEVTFERLAEIMLELAAQDCHNIGFVSPTHFAPQIVRAVTLAADRGLNLPLIYNTNAYDSVETVKLLEGIFDIYLPDLKYSDSTIARAYSKAEDYVVHARAAIQEMHRQVGSQLVTDSRGVLERGLVIRLLVLPNDLAGLHESLAWISSTLGNQVTLSVMSQYYPANQVGGGRYPLLDRKIRAGEYAQVLEWLDEFGFENGYVQPYHHDAGDYYRPDFNDRDEPFKDARDFKKP